MLSDAKKLAGHTANISCPPSQKEVPFNRQSEGVEMEGFASCRDKETTIKMSQQAVQGSLAPVTRE